MKKLILICSVSICAGIENISAQTESLDEIIPARNERVFLLNNKIAFMASPQYSREERENSKKSAQKLFVNDCNPFIEVVEFNDGTQEEIKREGVTLQVSSIKRRKPSTKLIPLYFSGLINLNYKYVKLNRTDVDLVEMSKLQPYGKDENGNLLYSCSVFYWQTFVGVTPEGRKYSDITKKRIVCYVQAEEVLDERTGEMKPEYMVRLGDVHIISTERLW